jgi:hypothetical protein
MVAVMHLNLDTVKTLVEFGGKEQLMKTNKVSLLSSGIAHSGFEV